LQNKRLKNALIFWLSCIVALAILVSGLFFLGKPVTKKSLVDALPAPDEGSFYILYVDETPTLLQMKNFVSFNKVLLTFPFFDRFDSRFISMFLTILEDSKNTACIAFPLERKFYLAIEPEEETILSVASGELPPNWKTAFPDISYELAEGQFRIDVSHDFSFWMALSENILFISTSIDDLNLMEQNITDKRKPSFPSWRIQRDWPGHLTCRMPSGVVSFNGFENIPSGAELAWFSDNEKLQAEWMIDGIEGIFSDEEIRLFQPQKWIGKYVLPTQRSLTLGVTMVDTPELMESVPLLANALGQTNEKMLEFLKGQTILTVGGKADVFSFSLPGILLQFPDRGEIGKTIVNDIWRNRLKSLSTNRSSIAGYESGGAIELPISLIAVSSDELTLIGLISKESLLSGVSLEEAFPNIVEREFLLWADIDFGSVANDIERILSIGDMIGDMPSSEVSEGMPSGKKFGKLFKVADELRSAGHLFIGIHNLSNGEIAWQYNNLNIYGQ